MPAESWNIIWSALGLIVTGLIGWGVTALTTLINSKIKDAKLKEMLTKVLNIVADAVKKIYQTFVEELKKEGKFDKAAAERAKQMAVDYIKSELTPELIEFIKGYFGDVETWIDNQIEVAIYNFKNK